nr:HIT family protein [Nanoarchaeum sp.]
MKDCIFCKIIKKEIPAKIFYEDKYCIAFLDVNPVNVGHTLIIPKTHFETINQMTKEDLDKLTEAILKLSKGIMCIADGLNVHQNNKPAAGQAVPHVHFHLIPRYSNDGYKFDWKLKKPVTEQENKEFLNKIKTFLK